MSFFSYLIVCLMCSVKVNIPVFFRFLVLWIRIHGHSYFKYNIQERLSLLSSGSVGRVWSPLDGVRPVLPRRPAHPSLPQEVVGEARASRELRRRRRGRRGRRRGRGTPLEGHLGAEQLLAGREGQPPPLDRRAGGHAQGLGALLGAGRRAARSRGGRWARRLARAVGRLLGAPALRTRGRPPRGGRLWRGRGWAARISGTGRRGVAVAWAGRWVLGPGGGRRGVAVAWAGWRRAALARTSAGGGRAILVKGRRRVLVRVGQGARGAGIEGQGREAMPPVPRGERRGRKGRTVALRMMRKEVDWVVEGRRVREGLRRALQGLQEGGRLVLLR